MSTIQATNLKHNASASNNIVLDASGNAAFAGTVVPSSSFLRNRLINGDFRVDQRSGGSTATVAAGVFSYATIDRWPAFSAGGSTQLQRVAGPTGFDNALEIRPQTGTTQTNVEQRIEATNCQDLVSTTATVSARLFADGAGVQVAVSWYYPIARDNWSSVTFVPIETITLTSGQYINYAKSFTTDANASRGMGIVFDIRNAAGRTVRMTGVQLEAGTVATPFERRQFGQELALCQRYFTNWVGDAGASGFRAIGSGYASGTDAAIVIPLSAAMRATPTVSFSGTISVLDGTTSGTLTSIVAAYAASNQSFWLLARTGSTFVTGRGAIMYTQNGGANVFSLSAEI